MYNRIIKYFNIFQIISSSARNGCSDNVCTLLASDSRHHGYESLASLCQHTTLYHYSGRKMMNKKCFINQIILRIKIMKTIHVLIQLLISCIRSLAIFWRTPTHASTPFCMPFFRNHSVEDFGQ